MARKKKRSGALADPEKLPPLDKDEKLQVIIETPKGSRNKYAFDEGRKSLP